jgi:integrase
LKQSWSAQNIGVASLASIARDITKALGLENWTQFSGHAWRRTAITFGVNAGMTLPQIKSMSGHHSDTVVQVS